VDRRARNLIACALAVVAAGLAFGAFAARAWHGDGVAAGLLAGSVASGVVAFMCTATARRPTVVGPASIHSGDPHERVVEAVVRLGVHVARADGSVDRAEINAIASFFEGDEASPRWERLLRDVVASEARQPNPRAAVLAARLLAEGADERAMVLVALAVVAAADGRIDPAERRFLVDTAAALDTDPSEAFAFAALGVDLFDGTAAAFHEDALSRPDAARLLGVSTDAPPHAVDAALQRALDAYPPERTTPFGAAFVRLVQTRAARLRRAREALAPPADAGAHAYS
jgi:uncharacterized membrane protein YebE (DUF533 family)